MSDTRRTISGVAGGLATAALLLAALGQPSTSAAAEPGRANRAARTADTAAITLMLGKYFAALNGSDQPTMVSLYTDDGVFLQPFRPTAVGKPAVSGAYDWLFKNEKMDVTFKITEVARIAPGWAIVRTSTEGPVSMLKTGAKVDIPTQELFVLKKENDGQWRIARFAFSPNDAPTR
jgi:uncharacterized protein (TIGR02246 family)